MALRDPPPDFVSKKTDGTNIPEGYIPVVIGRDPVANALDDSAYAMVVGFVPKNPQL